MSNILKRFDATQKKDIPEIKFICPASKQELLLRPFTTREQKAILKAIESEDVVLIGEAFDQLIRNCVITKGFRVEDMFSKDRDCLLIELSKNSVTDAFEYGWKCTECGNENTKNVNLNDLKYTKPVEDSTPTKEIQLETHDAKLVLEVSTRGDEINILKNSVSNKGVSGIELIHGAYAGIIKKFKYKVQKEIVNSETGEKTIEEKEVVEEIPFKERLNILEKLSVTDKNNVKSFFDDIVEYGYELNIGDIPCLKCGHKEKGGHELDWMSFFTKR